MAARALLVDVSVFLIVSFLVVAVSLVVVLIHLGPLSVLEIVTAALVDLGSRWFCIVIIAVLIVVLDASPPFFVPVACPRHL